MKRRLFIYLFISLVTIVIVKVKILTVKLDQWPLVLERIEL